MNLDEIHSLIENLSEEDKQKVIAEWASSVQPLVGAENPREPYNVPILSPLEFSFLPQLLTSELKRQNITYEEMAIQIGVSLSTFKRLIVKPASAKAVNLHALLKELGIKVWLEK